MGSLTLEELAFLAQVLSVPLFAGTLIYAAREVRELKRQVGAAAQSHRLQAARDFLDIIAVKEVRDTRRWLLSPEPFDPSSLSEEEHERAMRLAVAYDRVGLLIEHGLLDSEMVYLWQGNEVERLWRLVAPLVLSERRLPGRDRYCIYFERMGEDFSQREAAPE